MFDHIFCHYQIQGKVVNVTASLHFQNNFQSQHLLVRKDDIMYRITYKQNLFIVLYVFINCEIFLKSQLSM